MDKDGVRKELETILKNYGIYEGNDIPFDDENVADLIARLEAFVALQADKAVQDALEKPQLGEQRSESMSITEARLSEILYQWNFVEHLRHCMTPKYGEGTYTEERWTNEDLAKLMFAELKGGSDE